MGVRDAPAGGEYIMERLRGDARWEGNKVGGGGRHTRQERASIIEKMQAEPNVLYVVPGIKLAVGGAAVIVFEQDEQLAAE